MRTDLVAGRAWAINNAGQVVGEDFSTFHGFLWQNGVKTELGTLGGVLTIPYGINDSGQVVGVSETTVTRETAHAFLWQNGVMTDLGTLGGTNSVATAINDSGQVVGYSDTTTMGNIQHAFLSQNGVMTDLGTLGGVSSYASAINNTGQVVGYSQIPGGTQHAFLWQNGVMTDLGTLGGAESAAYGITSQDFLVDPVTDNLAMSLLHGSVVTTDATLLATKGRPVQGVAADGVTQAVIRIPAAAGDQLTLTVMNDQQPPAQSLSANEDGALGIPGDTSFSQNQITVVAQNTGSGAFAFAVYRAPLDFARPTGFNTYKQGGCSGASVPDGQSKCRTVSIRVQNQTRGTTNTIQVAILRPPAILIHGLWSNWTAWNTFSPLVSGPGTVDSRFSVGRVSYDAQIGPTIIGSDPSYQGILLDSVKENSLGFEYNAPRVHAQIAQWIKKFKGGNNPMGIPVAAVQADIVAHSMGGLITRTMGMQQTFLSDETFRQGNIHKEIDIDTPHLGSPLAIRLLAPEENGGCLQGVLAGKGNFTLSSIIFSDGTVSNGAILDLHGDGSGAALSEALTNLRQPGSAAHVSPTSLIVGVYQDFASLDIGALLVRNRPFGCPSDPLAQSLTSTGWPPIFGNQPNDGVVSENSQLNGLIPSPSSQYFGYVHSKSMQGPTQLGFSPPNVLDPGAIPNQVIFLLNTPLSNTVYFTVLNP